MGLRLTLLGSFLWSPRSCPQLDSPHPHPPPHAQVLDRLFFLPLAPQSTSPIPPPPLRPACPPRSGSEDPERWTCIWKPRAGQRRACSVAAESGCCSHRTGRAAGSRAGAGVARPRRRCGACRRPSVSLPPRSAGAPTPLRPARQPPPTPLPLRWLRGRCWAVCCRRLPPRCNRQPWTCERIP